LREGCVFHFFFLPLFSPASPTSFSSPPLPSSTAGGTSLSLFGGTHFLTPGLHFSSRRKLRHVPCLLPSPSAVNQNSFIPFSPASNLPFCRRIFFLLNLFFFPFLIQGIALFLPLQKQPGRTSSSPLNEFQGFAPFFEEVKIPHPPFFLSAGRQIIHVFFSL